MRTTGGQSNLTQSRIAAAYGRFTRIRQVAPMCTPHMESQKMVATAASLRNFKSAVSSLDSLTPKTHP